MTLLRTSVPSRERLDNGLVVIAQRTDVTAAVTIHVSVEAGTASEPEDQSGVAALTARLLDRGTARRSAERIAEELDERGVALKCSASRQTLTVTATCLAEDVPDVLDIVADVVMRPAFCDGQLERRRMEAITRLRQDEDNPFVRAADLLAAALYGPRHPYGRPFRGTADNLARLSRQDLLDFHTRTFRPGTASVAVVGDVWPAAALGWAEAVFGGWRGSAPDSRAVPPPPRRDGRRVCGHLMPGKSQADIAYGFTTIARRDPRFHAYWLMNNVLGEFGLGGRLAANIRERQGMAYYAFSSLDASAGEGPLVVRVGVDPGDVPRALDAIDAEVRALGAAGPTADEVEQSRESLIGSIPRMFETNQSTAAFLQMVERFDLGVDYADRLPGLLRAVSAGEVADAAAEVLRPETATAVIAGPAEAVCR